MDRITSADIWDLLPKHYPSRKDRDELIAAAKNDPNKERRVKIWDFFFPLNRDLILGPYREDLEKLRAERSLIQEESMRDDSSTRKKVAGHREQALRAQVEWESNLPEYRLKWRQSLAEKLRRRQLVSIGLFCIAGALGFFGHLTGELISESSAWGCSLILAIVPALAGVISMLYFQNSYSVELRGKESKEHRGLIAHVEWHEREAQKLEEALSTRKAAGSDLIGNLLSASITIQEKIANLEGQIPEDSTPEEVNSWLMEELREMERLLLRESGQENRLIESRSGKSTFCIRGPAELQRSDQLETVYLKGDLQKHLHARRAGMDRDGKRLDLYGVWIIEFLFLGEDEMTSHRVFYDFISGRRASRQRIHNYNSVTLIETRSQFRTIDIIRDGVVQEEVVDDVPSLFFALENGERIEINFPNEKYFEKTFPEMDLSLDLLYRPRQEATEAMRLLRENVHKARTRPREDLEGIGL